MAAGQFVDALGLDERRVHIEADEAAHAAVHVVLLEGEVHAAVLGQGHELLLEGGLVVQGAADGELHAGADVALRMLDAHAARQALDGVDVQAVPCDNLGGRLDLPGAEAAADGGEDVAVAALAAHPVLVLVVGDRFKADGDAHLGGLEKELLHHLTGGLLFDADENAQGEGAVDVRLADVQDLSVVLGEDGHDLGGKADTVCPGYAN